MTEPLFLVRTDTSFRPVGGQVLRTLEHVERAFSENRLARWIGRPADIGALLAHTPEPRATWHKLLLLGEASAARREMLGAFFRVVLAPGDGVRFLPDDDLVEVLGSPHPDEYLIGGVVDRDDNAVVLFRGNLDRLVVPLAWFKSSGDGTRPDADDFEIIDSGQTIRLGPYEAATSAVLYEFDDRVRARMKARGVERDDSFGGALRRLRLQRHVSQHDFPGISGKTVARIENGLVKKPHAKTRAILAKKLGVKPDEIESY